MQFKARFHGQVLPRWNRWTTMLRDMTGSRAVHASQTSSTDVSEGDLVLTRIDTSRRWTSTVDSCRDVPYWRELEEDEEAQKALREAGLA